MPRKICVPILSRANYGRLKSVLEAIKKNDKLELQVIIGASAVLPKYGLEEEIKSQNYNLCGEIWCTVEGDRKECMATTTGLLVTQLVQHFLRLKPDIVIVHADRYEMLAIATAASYLGIPLAHTQGGEVSGNIDDKVRNAITALADIHFTATERATKTLISKGIKEEKIFNVGCPTIDLLKDMQFEEPPREPYFMVVMHPVTTEEDNTETMKILLRALDYFKIKTIWIHSNIDAGNTQINQYLKTTIKAHDMKHIEFIDSISPEKFYYYMKNCLCLIGNTSSGLREGNYLGTPYLCLGDRQLNRQHGENAVFINPIYSDIIVRTLKGIMGKTFKYNGLYGNGESGREIAEILSTIKLF